MLTIDCGEGRHDACRGKGDEVYLIPQLAGEEFTCGCPCHGQKWVANERRRRARAELASTGASCEEKVVALAMALARGTKYADHLPQCDYSGAPYTCTCGLRDWEQERYNALIGLGPVISPLEPPPAPQGGEEG